MAESANNTMLSTASSTAYIEDAAGVRFKLNTNGGASKHVFRNDVLQTWGACLKVKMVHWSPTNHAVYVQGDGGAWWKIVGSQSIIYASWTEPNAASVPGAPTNVSASPGYKTATVTFSAPASDGGSPITGYTITANPAGSVVDLDAGSPSLSHTLKGLAFETNYTFTVKATNAVGQSAASTPSAAVQSKINETVYVTSISPATATGPHGTTAPITAMLSGNHTCPVTVKFVEAGYWIVNCEPNEVVVPAGQNYANATISFDGTSGQYSATDAYVLGSNPTASMVGTVQ
jgi:hypothetical protein